MSAIAEDLDESFDFIVIGGGTAGLVVAARLSEISNYSVLVLETGDNQLENPMINIPFMWPAILGSDVDWAFLTEPQAHLDNRVLRQPQGKALGGSSALNAQLFVSPSSAEINAWGTAGNPGWSWEAMGPYYRRCHTMNFPSHQSHEHLGLEWKDTIAEKSRGPIQVSFPAENKLIRAWLDTSVGIDLSLKKDPFSGEGKGMYCSPSSVDPVTKTRSYAAPAYLVPAQTRSNLTVATKATVHRILFDTEAGKAPKASAVMVERNGDIRKVKARKEIVLAAGVFNSPKLLELSGVGEAKLLSDLDIAVVVENPNVGENMQDHIFTGISFEAAEDVPTMDNLMRQDPASLQQATEEYQTTQTGPLSWGGITCHSYIPLTEALIPNGRSAVKNLFSSYSNDKDRNPAFDFVHSIIQNPDQASACLFAFPAQANFHDDKGERGGRNYVQMPKAGNFITLGAVLCHPLSRGNVHITSSDVQVDPAIDPNYLSHPLDEEVLARHVLSLETLAAKEPLASLLKPDGDRNHPQARLGSLEEVKAYARRTAVSENHPSGTCSMLPRDKGGVVDERLRVHGVTGLRVVDASVMPFIPRANIQSTVYAVAERAADLIKEDWSAGDGGM